MTEMMMMIIMMIVGEEIWKREYKASIALIPPRISVSSSLLDYIW